METEQITALFNILEEAKSMLDTGMSFAKGIQDESLKRRFCQIMNEVIGARLSGFSFDAVGFYRESTAILSSGFFNATKIDDLACPHSS